jgi:hypothetical protein
MFGCEDLSLQCRRHLNFLKKFNDFYRFLGKTIASSANSRTLFAKRSGTKIKATLENTIAMPHHPIGDERKFSSTTEKMIAINGLATSVNEARWTPTLLINAKNIL